MMQDVCGGIARDFAFDFERIFPAALFEDEGIREALTAAGIECDGRANRMAVFRRSSARIAFAEANDRVKEALWNAGWAVRTWVEEDPAARCQRLGDRIREKIASLRSGKISPQVMRLGILQLHRFEAERMKGRGIDAAALRAMVAERGESHAEPHRALSIWEAQTLIQTADMMRGAGAASAG